MVMRPSRFRITFKYASSKINSASARSAWKRIKFLASGTSFLRLISVSQQDSNTDSALSILDLIDFDEIKNRPIVLLWAFPATLLLGMIDKIFEYLGHQRELALCGVFTWKVTAPKINHLLCRNRCKHVFSFVARLG